MEGYGTTDEHKQAHIATLTRRAAHLFDKMDGKPDYPGRSYDLKELRALRWILETVGAAPDLRDPERADDDDSGYGEEPPRRAAFAARKPKYTPRAAPRRRGRLASVWSPGDPDGAE